MSSCLLIVESPSKAKTLKKYLGDDFTVLASYGHVRDLIPKNGAVDPAHSFAMKYQLIAKNAKHIDAIAKAVKSADKIYLATDPDREGEAISWHLVQILNGKKLLHNKPAQRVVFHEITQNAVLDAIAHPREISQDLVDAQQARRALDYLVGFNLSPLLWKKIRRGLSAGRVQSPALRLICERENEIRAFVVQEYWSIHLDSHKEKHAFSAKLISLTNKKLEQFDIPNADAQETILSTLHGHPAHVGRIEKKKKTRHPAAPFTTSTLQQEAVRKLGLTTDRTMRTAQQLYEGIDIGQGAVGLITYMRTDSVAMANEAIDEIRRYISEQFDADFLPANAVTFKNKTKNAQEAHEAIRPTSILRTPESVKSCLSPEQYKLYNMIWKRTLACQMAPAKFDTTSVDIHVGPGLFRAAGQVQIFAGFLAVYEEDVDDAADNDEQAILPRLETGESLPIDKLYGTQHFTQAPPRFSEASLVKSLEEYGIGRPSTYASIIFTLKEREYATLDKKRFVPTDTGEIVNKFLTEHFTQYVDYGFTARLEDQLDDIASGQRPWVPVMETFWGQFSQLVAEKESIPREKITTETLDEACPKCSQPLMSRFGKRGRFIGCSGYPACDYTRNIGETAEEKSAQAEEPEIVEGRTCPKDGGQLIIKKGPYGKFIGCAHYPKCKYIEPLEKPRDTGVSCPECKKGHLIERKSRYGKLFFSCNTYPRCKYATWNPPLAESCPQCGWPILTLKTTKRRGTEKICPQKECGFSEKAAESTSE